MVERKDPQLGRGVVLGDGQIIHTNSSYIVYLHKCQHKLNYKTLP
jgi:hypothetical protein